MPLVKTRKFHQGANLDCQGASDQFMNQHLLVKIPERRTGQLGTPHRCVACRGAAMRRSDEGREQDAISCANLGALIWTGPALRVWRSGIFPTQLNDSELIRGSLVTLALFDQSRRFGRDTQIEFNNFDVVQYAQSPGARRSSGLS
jgi:hypothetical protein